MLHISLSSSLNWIIKFLQYLKKKFQIAWETNFILLEKRISQYLNGEEDIADKLCWKPHYRPAVVNTFTCKVCWAPHTCPSPGRRTQFKTKFPRLEKRNSRIMVYTVNFFKLVKNVWRYYSTGWGHLQLLGK